MATIAQLKGWDSEEVFNVDGEILNQFSSIKELFGNADASNSEPLSLPNVSAATFQKVIEWCKHHKVRLPLMIHNYRYMYINIFSSTIYNNLLGTIF